MEESSSKHVSYTVVLFYTYIWKDYIDCAYIYKLLYWCRCSMYWHRAVISVVTTKQIWMHTYYISVCKYLTVSMWVVEATVCFCFKMLEGCTWNKFTVCACSRSYSQHLQYPLMSLLLKYIDTSYEEVKG